MSDGVKAVTAGSTQTGSTTGSFDSRVIAMTNQMMQARRE
jgi:hypothetical protein